MAKQGVLLINLGTPDDCTNGSVYRYLTQFLNDPRVVDLPWVVRTLLVNLIIVPFRYRASAKAYQQIWTAQGSPLLLNSQALQHAVASELGAEFQVELGMRYGNPSIANALDKFADLEKLTVIPLFPQYSSAATGSAVEMLFHTLAKQWHIPTLYIKNDFYNHPAFIAANAAIIREHLANKKPDLIIFSYHGLPERHLANSSGLINCYRTQCYETSRLLALALDLETAQYQVAFQSRLGRTPWIKPYLDELLPDLIGNNKKNIAVVCPSFVADCLETLEEIKVRAAEQWHSLGGGEFTFIPCVNDHPIWVKGLADIVRLQS